MNLLFKIIHQILYLNNFWSGDVGKQIVDLFEFLISDIALYMLIRCSNIYVLYLEEKVLELLK